MYFSLRNTESNDYISTNFTPNWCSFGCFSRLYRFFLKALAIVFYKSFFTALKQQFNASSQLFIRLQTRLFTAFAKCCHGQHSRILQACNTVLLGNNTAASCELSCIWLLFKTLSLFGQEPKEALF